jgi:hypothetical protein
MLSLAGPTGFPVSLFLEAAAAIGAGIVGGFIGATRGLVYGWTREQVEGNALRDGYWGAVLVVGLWLFRLCIVYAVGLWAT